MSYEEIIEIINEISNRIGATATDLYPKLVRYGIVTNLFNIAIGIIMTIASIYLIKNTHKKAFNSSTKDLGEEVMSIIICTFSIAGVLFGVVVTAACFSEVLLWLVSPDIQAIKFVMRYR